MDVEPGTIIGDKYRLERPLSRGGMGAVWLARHVQLGAPVAVKFMDQEHAASPEFRARFYREARTAANIESPHVVSVQDYGIQGTVPYLVMELLRGEDLGRRLRRLRRISAGEAARIAVQTGKALRRAHDAGLVHRDLKPGNLFLARVDDEEVVKVLDFGIAKQITGKLTGETTKTGELLGSPFYMSPEQARGDKDLDARSDLWSLGVILFRSVTGKLPFDGDVLGAVLSKILVDPIPQATGIVPDLPPALDEFFAQALSRDRTLRFQSALEMVRAFVLATGEAGIPLPQPSSSSASLPSATHNGTLLGLSPPSASAESPLQKDLPSELDVLSWPEPDSDPHPMERARKAVLSPLPDMPPSRTLTVAAAGMNRELRLPRARAVRWGLAAAALLVASGAVAIAALRPAGEGARPAAAQAQPVAEAPSPPPQPAPLAAAVPLATAAVSSPVASPLPAASAQAVEGASSARPVTTTKPRWRRSPRTPREIVDPWKGK
jgi:eukaryotic-like serine/threonine-protein kinase